MARSVRGWLYLIARLMGDINAVKRGRVGRRIGRRVAGKVTRGASLSDRLTLRQQMSKRLSVSRVFDLDVLHLEEAFCLLSP
jgi:hypothetical protein